MKHLTVMCQITTLHTRKITLAMKGYAQGNSSLEILKNERSIKDRKCSCVCCEICIFSPLSVLVSQPCQHLFQTKHKCSHFTMSVNASKFTKMILCQVILKHSSIFLVKQQDRILPIQQSISQHLKFGCSRAQS